MCDALERVFFTPGYRHHVFPFLRARTMAGPLHCKLVPFFGKSRATRLFLSRPWLAAHVGDTPPLPRRNYLTSRSPTTLKRLKRDRPVLPQSSSRSRRTASLAGFFDLSQPLEGAPTGRIHPLAVRCLPAPCGRRGRTRSRRRAPDGQRTGSPTDPPSSSARRCLRWISGTGLGPRRRLDQVEGVEQRFMVSNGGALSMSRRGLGSITRRRKAAVL